MITKDLRVKTRSKGLSDAFWGLKGKGCARRVPFAAWEELLFKE
jgi:hypothetical protein